MNQTTPHPLFSLGQVVATPGALAALENAGQGPQDFLSHHVRGKWGDLCEEDRRENQFSLERGLRLLSSYRTLAGVKLWASPNPTAAPRRFFCLASTNRFANARRRMSAAYMEPSRTCDSRGDLGGHLPRDELPRSVVLSPTIRIVTPVTRPTISAWDG
jgi:hypothetical protein